MRGTVVLCILSLNFAGDLVEAQPPIHQKPDDFSLLDALGRAALDKLNNPLAARCAAVVAISRLQTSNSSVREKQVEILQEALNRTDKATLHKDDDAVVFLTHVVQALGVIGGEARNAVPSIVVVCGYEAGLTQAAILAVEAILKPSPRTPHGPTPVAPKGVAGLLADLADAQDAAKRLAAAKALGELADPRVLTPLAAAAFGDPNPEVKVAAAAALAKVSAVLQLNRKDYVASLVTMLDKKNDFVLRIIAARRLGELGIDALSALEALTAASKEDDPDLKLVAANAIKRIQPK